MYLKPAAAVARRHEDGGRLAPQTQFQRPVHFKALIESLHRHQQRRRPAGEVQRLLVVRDDRQVRLQVRQRLLEA